MERGSGTTKWVWFQYDTGGRPHVVVILSLSHRCNLVRSHGTGANNACSVLEVEMAFRLLVGACGCLKRRSYRSLREVKQTHTVRWSWLTNTVHPLEMSYLSMCPRAGRCVRGADAHGPVIHNFPANEGAALPPSTENLMLHYYTPFVPAPWYSSG